MIPDDFTRYSLALMKGDKILYKSIEDRLKPLVYCVSKFKGKIDGCLLYDKVIGLAAARLIVHSKMIAKVVTPLASNPAIDLLKNNSIEIDAFETVANIMADDGENICPMERRALSQPDNEKFFHEMQVLMKFVID